MNNSHFSQSGITIFLKIFIILGLCTTAVIGLSASDHALQMESLNSSLLSTVILAKAADSVDIAKPDEPEESRAAFMKLGDIKGEVSDAESRIPAHTPEWTNSNASDPGVAGNSQDSKHKEWIDVESMSSPSAKGEKGGTTDMNIGVGELQKATSKSSSRKMLLRKKPGRTTYKGTSNDLKLTTPPLGYVCEGGGANDECFCEGVLDCNKLWLSTDCKKDTKWQDGNDPSKGGCTAAD